MSKKVSMTLAGLRPDPITHNSLKQSQDLWQKPTAFTIIIILEFCYVPKNNRQTSGEGEIECLELLEMLCGRRATYISQQYSKVFSISDGLNNVTSPKIFNRREWAAAVLLNENSCSMLNIASGSNQMADKLLGRVLKTMSCFDRSPL